MLRSKNNKITDYSEILSMQEESLNEERKEEVRSLRAEDLETQRVTIMIIK